MRKLMYLVAILCYSMAFAVQEVYDNEWTASTSESASWNGIATSENGQYIVAVACLGGSIYQSNDYGQTWSESTNAPSGEYNWYAVASDGSGSQLVVVSSDAGGIGGMYLSTDTGASWTATSVPTNMVWTSVASSTSGQYLMATASAATGGGGGIYVSNDYGDSWNAPFTGTLNFNSIAVSSNGKNAVVVTANGGIYLSTNYGATFSFSSAPATEEYFWVCSDSSGQYLVAVVQGGGIYYSLNNGTVWTLSDSAPTGTMWNSVTSDATGQYVAASIGCNGACYGYIYLSSDYGVTWYVSNSVSGSFNTLVSSANGKMIYAGDYGNVIYLGTVDIPTDDDNSINTIDDDNDNSDGLSDGAIAGIIVAAVVLFLVLAGCVYYFFQRKGADGKADLGKTLLP